MTSRHFDISWVDLGEPPKNRANPKFPDGKDIDAAQGRTPSCYVPLPYPTGRVNIGYWTVKCRVCLTDAVVTAASRRDDPRSIVLPCRPRRQEKPS